MPHYLQQSTRKSDLPIPLTYEVIDELLDLCRKGDVSELQQLLYVLVTESPPSVMPLDLLTASKGKDSWNNGLHMAAANGHYEVCRYLLTLLPKVTAENPNPIRPHPFVAQRNTSGNTPLHWAALNGHLDIVKLLIERGGAEPTVANNAGHNVLFEAQSADKEDVAKFLLENCPELAAPIGSAEEEYVNVDVEEEDGEEGKGKGRAKEAENVEDGIQELKISAGDTGTGGKA